MTLLAFCMLCFQSSNLNCQIETLNSTLEKALMSKDVAAIAPCYYDPATLVWHKTVIVNRDKIATFLSEQGQITAIKTLYLLEHNSNRFLELGHFQIADRQYGYSTGWFLEQGTWKREFQVVQLQGEGKPNAEAIHERRRQWVKLASQSTAKELIETTYTPETLYFSYGKLTKGRADLIERYSYMDDPDYTVNLAPRKSLPLGEQAAMEVGYYMTGGGGLGAYTLIWQKTAQDGWQIAFDANY